MGRHAPLAGLVIAGLTALAAVHPDAAGQQPQFRSRVDVVELDVSVIGRDQRPVKSLTASDFIVLENGQPQKVVGLREVDIPLPAAPPAAWMRDVAPDVRSNQFDEAPAVVLMRLVVESHGSSFCALGVLVLQ